MAAAWNSYISIVKELLNTKANPNIKDISNVTALYATAYNGQLEVVIALFKNYSSLNASPQDNNSRTPLHLVCLQGYPTIAKYLLKMKAIEEPDNNSWLLTHAAAFGGNLGIIKILAKYKGSVNVRINLKKSPLYLACRQGYFKMVKYLLDKELEKGVDNNRWLPIHDIA